MDTAPLLPPAATERREDVPASSRAPRISFRQPASRSGFVDAAWWPRSLDLAAEVTPLLELFWTAGREITRVTYNIAAWDSAPRRVRIDGRTVRLGGFTTSDPLTVRLSDAWGRERIDVLVVAPATDESVAARVLLLAGRTDNPYRAEEIMAKAGEPADGRPLEPA